MSRMSRSPVASRGARVALLGASTHEGMRVREQLERRRVPGDRVNLFGEAGEEVALGEYAGEARIVQASEIGDVAGHDIVFVCEAGEAAEALVWRTGEPRIVVDVVGAITAREKVERIDPRRTDPIETMGLYALTDPIAGILLRVLEPIEVGAGVDRAIATVARPAADFGEAGVQELREQTVRLLNFVELPNEHFGRQLAFNVIPESGLSCHRPGASTRAAEDVQALLDWDRPRLSLRSVVAGTFFGHAVQLHVQTREMISEEQLRSLLRDAGLGDGGDGPRLRTPLDVADDEAVEVGGIEQDPLGGYWIWVVAGGVATRAARQAVELLREQLRG